MAGQRAAQDAGGGVRPALPEHQVGGKVMVVRPWHSVGASGPVSLNCAHSAALIAGKGHPAMVAPRGGQGIGPGVCPPGLPGRMGE